MKLGKTYIINITYAQHINGKTKNLLIDILIINIFNVEQKLIMCINKNKDLYKVDEKIFIFNVCLTTTKVDYF